MSVPMSMAPGEFRKLRSERHRADSSFPLLGLLFLVPRCCWCRQRSGFMLLLLWYYWWGSMHSLRAELNSLCFFTLTRVLGISIANDLGTESGHSLVTQSHYENPCFRGVLVHGDIPKLDQVQSQGEMSSSVNNLGRQKHADCQGLGGGQTKERCRTAFLGIVNKLFVHRTFGTNVRLKRHLYGVFLKPLQQNDLSTLPMLRSIFSLGPVHDVGANCIFELLQALCAWGHAWDVQLFHLDSTPISDSHPHPPKFTEPCCQFSKKKGQGKCPENPKFRGGPKSVVIDAWPDMGSVWRPMKFNVQLIRRTSLRAGQEDMSLSEVWPAAHQQQRVMSHVLGPSQHRNVDGQQPHLLEHTSTPKVIAGRTCAFSDRKEMLKGEICALQDSGLFLDNSVWKFADLRPSSGK